MNIKNLVKDDDAVSPVIGVILMVAITVILAAVIASFVLGLGDQNNPAPTADFSFDYTNNGGSADEVVITHSDGDAIEPDNLYIRGDDLNSGGTNPGGWSSAGTGGGTNSDGLVASGNSVTLNDVQSSSYVINVVWEDPDSDSTSTLNTDRGPDA